MSDVAAFVAMGLRSSVALYADHRAARGFPAPSAAPPLPPGVRPRPDPRPALPPDGGKPPAPMREKKPPARELPENGLNGLKFGSRNDMCGARFVEEEARGGRSGSVGARKQVDAMVEGGVGVGMEGLVTGDDDNGGWVMWGGGGVVGFLKRDEGFGGARMGLWEVNGEETFWASMMRRISRHT